jgi:hypothetical protein
MQQWFANSLAEIHAILRNSKRGGSVIRPVSRLIASYLVGLYQIVRLRARSWMVAGTVVKFGILSRAAS